VIRNDEVKGQSHALENKTNVMHFIFNLLGINGLYMFQGLLVHPQEALYKRHLVYCVRVLSVGCTRANRHNTTQYTAAGERP
jgi:hypothetical protein